MCYPYLIREVFSGPSSPLACIEHFSSASDTAQCWRHTGCWGKWGATALLEQHSILSPWKWDKQYRSLLEASEYGCMEGWRNLHWKVKKDPESYGSSHQDWPAELFCEGMTQSIKRWLPKSCVGEHLSLNFFFLDVLMWKEERGPNTNSYNAVRCHGPCQTLQWMIAFLQGSNEVTTVGFLLSVGGNFLSRLPCLPASECLKPWVVPKPKCYIFPERYIYIYTHTHTQAYICVCRCTCI